MADVNAAAEAMGIPPELVSRSAAARADASGTTVDQVLDAWSGGGTVASSPPTAAEPEAPDTDSGADEVDSGPVETQTEETGVEPAAPAVPASPEVAVPEPSPRAAASGKPPVLVGVRDNPWTIVFGAFGLFVAVVLLAVVGPSIPVDEPGARSSEIALSAEGESGQQIYASLGCASCHTQMIRPVVADVGLGPVTLSDTNQILGTRRHGPDLADVGSRISGTQLESIVRGGAGHPGHDLSGDDMADLVAYLLESTTSTGGGG